MLAWHVLYGLSLLPRPDFPHSCLPFFPPPLWSVFQPVSTAHPPACLKSAAPSGTEGKTACLRACLGRMEWGGLAGVGLFTAGWHSHQAARNSCKGLTYVVWILAISSMEAGRTTSLLRTSCELAQTPTLLPGPLKIDFRGFLAFSNSPLLVKLRQSVCSLPSRALTAFFFSFPHCLICPLTDTNGFLNEPRTIDSVSQLKPDTLQPPFT